MFRILFIPLFLYESSLMNERAVQLCTVWINTVTSTLVYVTTGQSKLLTVDQHLGQTDGC